MKLASTSAPVAKAMLVVSLRLRTAPVMSCVNRCCSKSSHDQARSTRRVANDGASDDCAEMSECDPADKPNGDFVAAEESFARAGSPISDTIAAISNAPATARVSNPLRKRSKSSPHLDCPMRSPVGRRGKQLPSHLVDVILSDIHRRIMTGSRRQNYVARRS